MIDFDAAAAAAARQILLDNFVATHNDGGVDDIATATDTDLDDLAEATLEWIDGEPQPGDDLGLAAAAWLDRQTITDDQLHDGAASIVSRVDAALQAALDPSWIGHDTTDGDERRIVELARAELGWGIPADVRSTLEQALCSLDTSDPRVALDAKAAFAWLLAAPVNRD